MATTSLKPFQAEAQFSFAGCCAGDLQEVLRVVQTLVSILLRILRREPAVSADCVAVAEGSGILEDPVQIGVLAFNRRPVNVVSLHAELGDDDLSVAVANGGRGAEVALLARVGDDV